MSDKGNSAAESWLQKAEDALQRATEAVAEAWKATEDVRGQAWETAKHAVDQAAEALDHGIDAAKQTWHDAAGESHGRSQQTTRRPSPMRPQMTAAPQPRMRGGDRKVQSIQTIQRPIQRRDRRDAGGWDGAAARPDRQLKRRRHRSRLADAGFDHFHQVVVGDNVGRVAAAITEAAGRADALIITGGIGPTLDDLTRTRCVRSRRRDAVQ